MGITKAAMSSAVFLIVGMTVGGEGITVRAPASVVMVATRAVRVAMRDLVCRSGADLYDLDTEA